MAQSGRWDRLDADLAAQAEVLDAQQRATEVAERLRHEVGRVLLVDRLRAGLGSDVVLACSGQVTVRGVLSRVASDALVVLEAGGRECLVASSHVLSVSGMAGAAATPRAEVSDRLGFRILLRAIARDRSGVRLALVDGSAVDGTIDRIGADYVELAAHPAAEARRRGAVRGVRVVPLGGLVAVRRDGG